MGGAGGRVRGSGGSQGGGEEEAEEVEQDSLRNVHCEGETTEFFGGDKNGHIEVTCKSVGKTIMIYCALFVILFLFANVEYVVKRNISTSTEAINFEG